LSLNLFSELAAENNITFSGGINLARVRYKKIANRVNISFRSGFNIAIETKAGPEIIGLNFLQRGGNIAIKETDEKLTYTFNYITGYALHPVQLNKKLILLGGINFGQCIRGSNTLTSNNITYKNKIEAKFFMFDIGLQLGANIMFNNQFGIRAIYYFGITDVAMNISSDYNFKNQGLGITFLIK